MHIVSPNPFSENGTLGPPLATDDAAIKQTNELRNATRIAAKIKSGLTRNTLVQFS